MVCHGGAFIRFSKINMEDLNKVIISRETVIFSDGFSVFTMMEDFIRSIQSNIENVKILTLFSCLRNSFSKKKFVRNLWDTIPEYPENIMATDDLSLIFHYITPELNHNSDTFTSWKELSSLYRASFLTEIVRLNRFSDSSVHERNKVISKYYDKLEDIIKNMSLLPEQEFSYSNLIPMKKKDNLQTQDVKKENYFDYIILDDISYFASPYILNVLKNLFPKSRFILLCESNGGDEGNEEIAFPEEFVGFPDLMMHYGDMRNKRKGDDGEYKLYNSIINLSDMHTPSYFSDTSIEKRLILAPDINTAIKIYGGLKERKGKLFSRNFILPYEAVYLLDFLSYIRVVFGYDESEKDNSIIRLIKRNCKSITQKEIKDIISLSADMDMGVHDFIMGRLTPEGRLSSSINELLIKINTYKKLHTEQGFINTLHKIFMDSVIFPLIVDKDYEGITLISDVLHISNLDTIYFNNKENAISTPSNYDFNNLNDALDFFVDYIFNIIKTGVLPVGDKSDDGGRIFVYSIKKTFNNISEFVDLTKMRSETDIFVPAYDRKLLIKYMNVLVKYFHEEFHICLFGNAEEDDILADFLSRALDRNIHIFNTTDTDINDGQGESLSPEEKKVLEIVESIKRKDYINSFVDFAGLISNIGEDPIKILERRSIEIAASGEEAYEKENNNNIIYKGSYSYSCLSTYDMCPKKFFYRYVLKLPEIKTAGQSKGISSHDTLEYLLKMEMYGKKISVEDADRTLRKVWVSAGYRDKEEENKMFDTVKKSIYNFVDDNAQQKGKTIAVEKQFSIKLFGKRFYGRIDRIDIIGGKYRLIDYKTSDDEKELIDNLQLFIYAQAVKEMYGEYPKWITIWNIISGKIKEIEFSRMNKKKIEDKIKSIISNIDNKEFSASPSEICLSCDYMSICDAWVTYENYT